MSLREKSIRPVSTYWTGLLFWCVRRDRRRSAVQVVLRWSGTLFDPRLHRHAHAHREHDDDPREPRRAILPWGTTTVCTDPHEIGNVMGLDGVRFMLENAKKSKLRQYVLAPSCVPSLPRDGKQPARSFMPRRSANCSTWTTSSALPRSWTMSASCTTASVCTPSSMRPAPRHVPAGTRALLLRP